eukprot:3556342-Prymnesium_polylepis.1
MHRSRCAAVACGGSGSGDCSHRGVGGSVVLPMLEVGILELALEQPQQRQHPHARGRQQPRHHPPRRERCERERD